MFLQYWNLWCLCKYCWFSAWRDMSSARKAWWIVICKGNAGIFLRDTRTHRISYQRCMLYNCRFYIQRINLKGKNHYHQADIFLPLLSCWHPISHWIFAIWSLLAFSVAICLPLRKKQLQSWGTVKQSSLNRRKLGATNLLKLTRVKRRL